MLPGALTRHFQALQPDVAVKNRSQREDYQLSQL